MPDLKTKYMGLKLKNPLIVSSSSLTNSVKAVRSCAEAGAGAVVLKSLFEEQIESDVRDMEDESWPYPHPEAFDYVRNMGLQMGKQEYLKLIEEAKQEVAIPVIASLNCISPKWWVDYAKEIASAGADALELNVAYMPTGFHKNAKEIEGLFFKIIEAVKNKIDLPVAVKIGPYFTSLPLTAYELAQEGVSALVLFNRFYQIDIDLEKMKLAPGYRFSSPDEMHLPLRWVAVLYKQVDCDLAASTGVHDGDGVIKMLLAGATAVQVCSVLYMKGMKHLEKMIKTLEVWMDKKEYASIDDFRGKMSRGEIDEPEYYERLQYIKALVGIE